MKILSTTHAVIFGFAIVLAGCETVESRIQEKSALYAQLGPRTQQAIKQGMIGPGFTPEMVYMALGKPDHIETNANGQETTWVFFNFNTPTGKFFDYAPNVVGTSTNVDSLTKGFESVAGATDLRNGELQPQDVVGDGQGGLSTANRRKTAMEMISSDLRQDLHLNFQGGKLVSFELEIVAQ